MLNKVKHLLLLGVNGRSFTYVQDDKAKRQYGCIQILLC